MRKLGLALTMTAALCMTACGSTIPDMTEEENAQVVEYAAGLLLKYDENHHGRLVEEAEIIVEENSEDAVEEQIQPQEEPVREEEQEETMAETPVIDVSEEENKISYNSIEEFYGISDVWMIYEGYEVKDIYPDSETEEMFFAMTATEGRKLLVLEFDVVNVGTVDKNLDMLSVGAKFKVSVNGSAPRYALTTMLMNDLASYTGTIPVGASEKLVLVVELPEEDVQSIEKLSLVMKKGAEDATVMLN